MSMRVYPCMRLCMQMYGHWHTALMNLSSLLFPLIQLFWFVLWIGKATPTNLVPWLIFLFHFMCLQSPLKLNLLPAEARISSKEYNERVFKGEAHVLVDVRPAHHYKIVSLPRSMNIPLSNLEARLSELSSVLKKDDEQSGSDGVSAASLYVVCRRGNDSQRAVQYLHKMGFTSAKDIIGGLESWAHDVDPTFPTY